MLLGQFVLAAILTTAPAQPAPQPTGPGVVKVYYTVPQSAPIATSTAPTVNPGLPLSYAPVACAPATFPVYSPGCGTRGCADACYGTSWGDKCRKIWDFLTYKSMCKTPHSKGCADYTPPVRDFLPACHGGISHAACCPAR